MLDRACDRKRHQDGVEHDIGYQDVGCERGLKEKLAVQTCIPEIGMSITYAQLPR